jgi:Holliday junction resolvase RusA-like endonuclease
MEKRLVMTIEPKPKERPRAAIIGGHARIFTPKTTEAYEKEIRAAWVRANGDKPEEGPLRARIYFGLPIPKSETKANKLLMVLRKVFPTKRPDLDNLIKSVLDALNGVAYKDDCQIVTMLSRKNYAEAPYVKVILNDEKPKEGENE